MVDDLNTVPLSALTNESRSVLSLLNRKKVLPIVGPDQLSRHRDWRGLASLALISTEVAASINECQDKIAEVLKIWSKMADNMASVGKLLEYLQIIDRHDVYDDLIELAKNNKLFTIVSTNGVSEPLITWGSGESEFITYDDKNCRSPQTYHAYVLYAHEDKEFVDELINRMNKKGFKLCTEDNLLLGYASKMEAVSRLILERCRYIVLIFSPDFLRSPANTFYAYMAQSHALGQKLIKLIPIMYRECKLPGPLAQYHRLNYRMGGELNPIFWDRLILSLHSRDIPDASNHSQTNTSLFDRILNISNKDTPSNKNRKTNGYNGSSLTVPIVPTNSSSLNDIHKLDIDKSSPDTKSLGTSSQTSEKKKKPHLGSRIFKTLGWKKHKIV